MSKVITFSSVKKEFLKSIWMKYFTKRAKIAMKEKMWFSTNDEWIRHSRQSFFDNYFDNYEFAICSTKE